MRNKERVQQQKKSIYIYVISIKEYRKVKFMTAMSGLEIEAIGGVNGNELNTDELLKSGRIRKVMKPGVLGCLFSHSSIWQKMVENRHNIALVFEDDARFVDMNENSIRQKQRILNKIDYLTKYDKDWDILLLGRNPRKNKNGYYIGNGIVKPLAFWGMFAYVVNLKGVRKLLAHKDFIKPSRPCDVVMSDMGLNNKLNIFACHPEICTYDRSFPSDTFRLR